MNDKLHSLWKRTPLILGEALIATFATALISEAAYLGFHRRVSFADVLAILAIWFAIIHFLDSRSQEKKINEIAQSMSTQFIGCFPINVDGITKVIAKAHSQISVLVDYVGYAQYSAPRAYARYKDALIQAAGRGINIRILCYEPDLAQKDMLIQFPDSEEAFRDESSRERFKEYFRFERGVHRPKDMKGLRKILDEEEGIHTQELKNLGTTISFVSERPDFFLWLKDDEEAVFAFQNLAYQDQDTGVTDRGFSLNTRDGHLIEPLKEAFEYRWQKAVKSHPPDQVAKSAGQTQ